MSLYLAAGLAFSAPISPIILASLAVLALPRLGEGRRAGGPGMLGVFGLSRVRFFSSRKMMQAMTATVAMETPTLTPMAVLLLWDICVAAAAALLWVDAGDALVSESVDAEETEAAKVVLPKF